MAISGTVVKCKQCHKERLHRARGLCRRCYYSEGRERFKKHRRGHGGVGTFSAGKKSSYSLPDEPTAAPAGSEEKIAVLVKRFEQRTALWHPLDSSKKLAYCANLSERLDCPDDE